MNRKNIIFNVILLVLTLGAVFGVALTASNNYKTTDTWLVLVLLISGGIVAGLINAFAHELGHLIAGKVNGFILSDMTVWFFRWSKEREKIRFDFTLIGEQAGYTEMFPDGTENLGKRYKKMVAGGLIASFVCMLIGVVPLFLTDYIPFEAYAFWAMLLPLGAYYFIGNALPMVSGGAKNDGEVLSGLIKNDDSSKVAINLLAIQSELYYGKTPSQIDEKWYFDLPQLAEDDINFILLLNARYAYYLDKEDYENAKKVSQRLVSLVEYMPKYCELAIKAEALYLACTSDKNEDVADELTYELEKYLNANNDATAMRVKTVYTAFIKGEKQAISEFFDKWKEETEKAPLEGVELYEKKLLDRAKLQLGTEA